MEKLEAAYMGDHESDVYVRVRALEGRMLPDEIVKNLPVVSKSNPYHQEWLWRKRSFARLQAHISRRFQGARVRLLDLGCGNGWMCRRFAAESRFEVFGVEINAPELAQATRLFSGDNLQFSKANIMAGDLGERRFDVIVLAASVQYFPDLGKLFQTLRKHLLPNGEIHLIDSKFYLNDKEKDAAKTRSARYYAELGVPDMGYYYHHHSTAEILQLGGVNMNKHLTIKFLQKIKWLSPLDWFVLG